MKMDLRAPCANCPFRSDVVPYLTIERVEEIIAAITDGDASFSCHKHNSFGEDDEGDSMTIEGPDAQHCAGAMILLEKIEQPNQWMRIAERLRIYNRHRLKMNAPVYDSPEEMIEAYDQ
jgi:hypothetical protein